MFKFKFIDCSNEYVKEEFETLSFIRDTNNVPYMFCHCNNDGDLYYYHKKICLKDLRHICETKYNLLNNECLNIICCHSSVANDKNKLDMTRFCFITNHIVGATTIDFGNNYTRLIIRETGTNNILDEILFDVLHDSPDIFKTEDDFLIMMRKVGETNLQNIVDSDFYNIKYDNLYKFISYEEGHNLYIKTKKDVLKYIRKVLFHY